MTKKDMQKEIDRLKAENKTLREDPVNAGFEEMILDIIRRKLTFEKDNYDGHVNVKVDGQYLDSFYVGD